MPEQNSNFKDMGKEMGMEEAEQQLFTYLSSVHPIPDEEWIHFQQALSYNEFEKGTLLTKKDQLEQFIYFLLEGFVRVFAPINGVEHCTNFRFRGEFTSSITSFISRNPSLYTVEALSHLKVFQLHYNDVQTLYKTCPSINTLGRKIIESLYIEKHKREIAFLSLSAEERYRQLLKKHPDFVHNISVKHLASYLGVSPETLSRIRSNLKDE